VASPTAESSLLRFGIFELDLRQQELRRGGVLVKLTPQQLRVLRFLAEHTGEICTREQIQHEVWGPDLFVDFDRGLNVCIAAIRSALNDSSESPRFIQTVPRQGYRFVAPVEQLPQPVPPAPPVRRSRRVPVAIVAVAGVIGLCAVPFLIPHQPRRLAVLPFENLTGVAGDAPVAAGLTDELTTQIGAADPARLAVIGRTSAARYANGKATLTDLASDFVIEGSVRSEAGETRVSVRLLEARGQTQIWNHTYQTSGSNRLEMQQTLAADVTSAVTAKLLSREARSPAAAYRPDPQAAEAYWNGRYLDRRDPERAIRWMQESAARDPRFAAPRAALAEIWLTRALSGADPAPGSFANARQAAEEALRIDERSAEAHATLGTVCFWNDWNFGEARRQFKRALELNGSLARAHHDYGFLLVETGEPKAGIDALRTAIALDPVSPRVNIDAGWVFLQARRYNDAIRYAKRALELEPRLEEARMCIARAELYQGKESPGTLERLKTSRNPYYRAMAAAIQGAKPEALSALDEALAAHNVMLTMLGTEPAFDSLRHDPRFQELRRKVAR
jgi:DNA-binding winged helix-turn-helix (wHTH) protein/TolB-like protein/Tfp pilus assembly protein PilF